MNGKADVSRVIPASEPESKFDVVFSCHPARSRRVYKFIDSARGFASAE